MNWTFKLLWLTVGIMLLGVLSFVDLAGGVVSFAHPACIRHSFGAQNTVTAHSLWEKNTRHLFSDRKVAHTHKMQQFIIPRNKLQQPKTTIIYPLAMCWQVHFSSFMTFKKDVKNITAEMFSTAESTLECCSSTSKTPHMISSSENLALKSCVNQIMLLSHRLTFKSITSHSPSMQTLELSCEQSVPSLTLLARAKKKS